MISFIAAPTIFLLGIVLVIIMFKDLTKGDYSKLVAVLSYMNECRMPLPPPYKEYARQWESIARELVTA